MPRFAGKRPWRRGPDHDKDFATRKCRVDQCRIALEREFHVDRWARVLMIFNFSFREGGLILETPVNRPCAFVNPTTLDKARKHPRRFGLVVVRHREVGIVPLAEYAESFEVACLALQRILCVLATDPAKSLNVQIGLLFTLFLERLFDVCFDWQTVTVVARNVRRVVAHHRARFDDEVFENLVHRGAEMNIGIRVRRTIVKNELLTAFTRAADQAVKVEFGPFFKARRFALRQIGFLRKSGLRQVDGFL